MKLNDLNELAQNKSLELMNDLSNKGIFTTVNGNVKSENENWEVTIKFNVLKNNIKES